MIESVGKCECGHIAEWHDWHGCLARHHYTPCRCRSLRLEPDRTPIILAGWDPAAA